MKDQNKYVQELTPLDHAISYIRKGYAPIPTPYREKSPGISGWNALRITEEDADYYFPGGEQNISFLLGEPSGGLIDIDIDWYSTVGIAPHFLPPTPAVFGRDSKPRSHWLYRYKGGELESDDYGVPKELKPSDEKCKIIEFRYPKPGKGAPLVAPGSHHADTGELIQWYDDGEPLELDKDGVENLRKQVRKTAIASFLLNYYPGEGSRNEFCLALNTVLLQANWNVDDVDDFIDKLAYIANDEECESRGGSAARTKILIESGQEVTGTGKIRDIIGDEPAKYLFEKLLGLKKGNSNLRNWKGKSKIREVGGCLVKPVKDELEAITSFTIKPAKAVQVPDDGEHLHAVLKSSSGKESEVVFPPSAWINNQSFIKCLPSKEFVFTGTSTDVQHIRQYISTFDMPHMRGVTTAGFQGNVFVTDDGALTKDGFSEEIIFQGDNPARCSLLSTEPASKEDFRLIAESIHDFNIPTVVLPILGWLTACFFKPAIMELHNQFPLLSIEGEAGAGKSETIDKIVRKLWCLDSHAAGIAEQSKFTFMKHLDGSNAIPKLFEENKHKRMTQRQQDLVSNIIRESYNAVEGQRGRANQSMVIYRYQAPVVIIGESGSTEPAVLDRLVPVRMSKKDSSPCLSGFRKSSELPLDRLGRALLEKSLRTPLERVKDLLDKELNEVDSDLTDRPRYNAAVVRFGLEVMGEVLGIEFNKKHVDSAIKEAVYSEGSSQRKSAVAQLLELMGVMSEYNEKDSDVDDKIVASYRSYTFHSGERLEEGIHYAIFGTELRLNLSGAYPILQKWIRSHGYDGDQIPKDTFLIQVKREEFFLEKKMVRFGSKTRNCIILDMEKMMSAGIPVPEEWYGGFDRDDGSESGQIIDLVAPKRRKLFGKTRKYRKRS
jgi:hypothetical protein